MKSFILKQTVQRLWLGMMLLVCTTSTGQAQAQVTTNLVVRVRMIRPAGRDFFGTAFTLEVDGRQYLITAKHVVAGMKAEDTLEIHKGDQWVGMKVKVLRCQDPIDIAVLVPPQQLTVTFPLEPTMKGIVLAQDVYFAGFPYGLFMAAPAILGAFPVPLIKKAIISAIVQNNGATMLLLDGHNNPGFSGGPIVYRDPNRSNVAYKLAGVVSGFQAEPTPVLKLDQITPQQVTPEDIAEGSVAKFGSAAVGRSIPGLMWIMQT